MLDDFMVRAALAGVGLACVAGPLGCFVVWRRMAYFGDATAHAAILGMALSLAFSVSIFLGVLVMALVMASATSMLSGRIYAMDTLLGVAAHAALALGLVAVSFLSGVRVDLMAYLFGDILAVGFGDVLVQKVQVVIQVFQGVNLDASGFLAPLVPNFRGNFVDGRPACGVETGPHLRQRFAKLRV